MFTLAITAHHEAAHTVVLYRMMGVAEYVSIVSNVTTSVDGEVSRILGHTSDTGYSDSFDAAHMEARVLSCYAGGHAQRRCDPSLGDEGCDIDDAIAADVLRDWAWERREQEFRDRSGALVDQYWPEIVAVANELLRMSTLDCEEVQLIADAAAGPAEFIFGDLETDLAQYRKLRGPLQDG